MHVVGVADSPVVLVRCRPAVAGCTEAVGRSLAEADSLGYVSELLKLIKNDARVNPYLDDSFVGRTYLQLI